MPKFIIYGFHDLKEDRIKIIFVELFSTAMGLSEIKAGGLPEKPINFFHV